MHLAAYRALGLDGWTYERIECTADQLPSVVGGFGPEWVGVSVTMPGKFAALRFADERTPRAEMVGSANTLVRCAAGWRADNTDVDGVVGAMGTVTAKSGIVIGSGGTARATVVGLAVLGVSSVTIVARDRAKAEPLVELGSGVGVEVRWRDLAGPGLADEVAAAGVVVSTVPADVAAAFVAAFKHAAVLLDAIYEPWPTPLAAAVNNAGGRAIGGLEMLLHQAFAQVELFTGRPAPKEAMRAALSEP